MMEIPNAFSNHAQSHGINSRELSSAGDVLVEIFSNLLLFLLIFGMSATVDILNLRRQLRNKYAIFIGMIMQFVVMPLCGFLSVIIFKNSGLTQAVGVTLLIVTSSPGGSYSNWWCSLFNADLALSVAMTALSTIFSVVFLPANLLLYSYAAYGFSGENSVLKNVSFPRLFISIAIVIAAIVSGLYASYKINTPRFHRMCNTMGTISGIALIVFSAVFSSNKGESKPWNQPWSFYVGVASPCIVGLILSNILCYLAKLNKPEIVTGTILNYIFLTSNEYFGHTAALSTSF
jgi:predicted Na+-dependent transporter